MFTDLSIYSNNFHYYYLYTIFYIQVPSLLTLFFLLCSNYIDFFYYNTFKFLFVILITK